MTREVLAHSIGKVPSPIGQVRRSTSASPRSSAMPGRRDIFVAWLTKRRVVDYCRITAAL